MLRKQFRAAGRASRGAYGRPDVRRHLQTCCVYPITFVSCYVSVDKTISGALGLSPRTLPCVHSGPLVSEINVPKADPLRRKRVCRHTRGPDLAYDSPSEHEPSERSRDAMVCGNKINRKYSEHSNSADSLERKTWVSAGHAQDRLPLVCRMATLK